MNSTVESRLQETEKAKNTEQTLQQRYHYLDNLRALAMIAGVLFHAALAYSPMLHTFSVSAGNRLSAGCECTGKSH